MSVLLGLLHKSASHKIPSLRYVILGHVKKCQRSFTISQTRNQFRGGFLNPLLLWGGPYGDGGRGGAQGSSGSPGGGEGGGEVPRGEKGRAPGREGQGRDQGGKGPGPIVPNVTSVCLIIAAVIGLLRCCLGFLAAVTGLFGHCHWFLRPLGTMLLRTSLACHGEVYRDLKVAVSVRE